MLNDITLDELLTLIISISENVALYWNVLIAGGSVILGIVLSEKFDLDNNLYKIILSVLFVLFACGNLIAIVYQLNRWGALIALIPEDAALNPIKGSFSPPNTFRLSVFQIAIQILVVIIIWALPKRKNQVSMMRENS